VVVDPDNKPSLNFGLAAVVYEWARGVSFRDITQVGGCPLTTVHPSRLHPSRADHRRLVVVPTYESSLYIAPVLSPPDHRRPCYFVRGR
jgi:hypothetical protein